MTNTEDNEQDSSAANPNAKILSDIDDQIQNWHLFDDTRISQDTGSTIPLPHASILKHQKKDSNGTIKNHHTGRPFTEPEMLYLSHVLNSLCELIVGTALNKSAIQYRNTFAWKFHVPGPFSRGLTTRLRNSTSLTDSSDIGFRMRGRDSKLRISFMNSISVVR